MRLSFVLVHYHGPDLVEDAVSALRSDLDGGAGPAEIVVVDNGSTARARAQLAALPVTVVDAGGNRGYAGAINLGVTRTAGEAVVVMNPDVLVLPGCTAALASALRDGAAAAGPRFYWDRERRFLLPPTEERTRRAEILALLAEVGGRPAAWGRRLWRRRAHRFWLAEQPFTTRFLSGALLALRRDALDRVGPFDEGFRLYFEEDDWLLRLRRSGLSARYVPAAQAIHLYNQSAAREPKAAAWFQESATRFRRRHYGPWFVRFLAKAAPSPGRVPVPAMLPAGPPCLELDSGAAGASQPSWLEVSPLPRGFPAGATALGKRDPGRWRFPAEVWERLAPGRYFLTLCGTGGAELGRYGFDRHAEAG